MKIYIAGASKEPERVRRWMSAARTAGLVITLDWLAVIEAVGHANEGLSDEDRTKYAVDDWRAVREADLVWLLAPENPSTGAWVELGLALAGQIEVIVSGPARHRSIFAALATEYDHDEDAFAAIVVRHIRSRTGQLPRLLEIIHTLEVDLDAMRRAANVVARLGGEDLPFPDPAERASA